MTDDRIDELRKHIGSYIRSQENPYFESMFSQISTNTLSVDAALDFLLDLSLRAAHFTLDNIKFLLGIPGVPKPDGKLISDLKYLCTAYLVQRARASEDDIAAILQRFDALEYGDADKLALLQLIADIGSLSSRRIFVELSEDEFVRMTRSLEVPVVDNINSLSREDYRAEITSEHEIQNRLRKLVNAYYRNSR